MTSTVVQRPDPKLDLVLERVVDVPPRLVFAAWTRPELLKRWFTGAPWEMTECEIDLCPGGVFRWVMRGPEGKVVENTGCCLEIVENEKFAWTGALGPGWRPRPVPPGSFLSSVVIALEPRGAGTKYTALVVHGDEAARRQHEEMGFHERWGKTLDQLVALAKTL